MSNKKFDAFVNEQISQKAEQRINWEKRREEWLSHVQVFFKQVKEFLHDYVSKGQIEIVFSPMKINEEYLGEYELQKACIFIGKNQIVLEPVGALIIGAFGRIDMKGAYGTIKFILTDTELSSWQRLAHNDQAAIQSSQQYPELIWKISTPPPIQYQALTQESFLECLMEVTNG